MVSMRVVKMLPGAVTYPYNLLPPIIYVYAFFLRSLWGFPCGGIISCRSTTVVPHVDVGTTLADDVATIYGGGIGERRCYHKSAVVTGRRDAASRSRYAAGEVSLDLFLSDGDVLLIFLFLLLH